MKFQTFLKLLVNKALIFQFVFIYPITNANAGVIEDKVNFGQRLKDSVQTEITDFLCEKAIGGQGESTVQDIGCKAVGIAAGKSPEVMETIIDMVLIMSMSVSLINSDCKVTESGKKHLPKSYTSGITHWIHKLASLIYIYAELQNLIALRKLKGKYEKLSKKGGQAEKFRTLIALQEEKVKALEKKQEILEISTMGFGAAGAVELGMSAGMAVWGAVKSSRETMDCNVRTISSETCAVPGKGSASVAANVKSAVTRVATDCTAKYTKENLVGSLISEAKSQVKGRLMSAIGRAVGGQVTQALGGGGGAQIIGEASGAVLGQKYGSKAMNKVSSGVGKTGEAVLGEENSEKVGGYISKSLAESGKDGINLRDPSGQLQQCVKGKTKKEMTDAAKSYATAAALDSCAGTMGTTCAVAATAHCALQVAWAKEGCQCALRNIKDGKDVAAFLKKNTDLPTELTTNPEMLSRMAASIKSDDRYYSEGVEEDDLVCGVDYSGWPVRHDLECRPVFDFLKDEDQKEKEKKELAQGNEKGADENGGDENGADGQSDEELAKKGEGEGEAAAQSYEEAGYMVNTLDLGDKKCKEYIDPQTSEIKKTVCEGDADYIASGAPEQTPPAGAQEKSLARETTASSTASTTGLSTGFSQCIGGKGRIVDGEVYCFSGLKDPNEKPLAPNSSRYTSIRVEGDQKCTYVDGVKAACQKYDREIEKENARLDPKRSQIMIDHRTHSRLQSECGGTVAPDSGPERRQWQQCRDRVRSEVEKDWYEGAFFNPAFFKELRYLENFEKEKAKGIFVGLQSSRPEKWAELFLGEEALIGEYRSLSFDEKGKVNTALELLARAIYKLKEQIIPSAHAEGKDQFVSMKEEGSLLGGLGITALGLLLFPKWVKRFLNYSTVLQRTPLRRGAFYTASYFIANQNVKSNKGRIKKTKKNIEAVKNFMKKNGISLETPKTPGESAFKTWSRLFGVSAAHASTGPALAPLCIERGGFSTACVCRERGGCGNEITNRSYRSELFKIKAINDFFATQLSFARKMSKGEVKGDDYPHYKNTLEVRAQKIDPEIASENLDRILHDSGLAPLRIFDQASRFTASIKRSALREAYQAAGKKFDPKASDFDLGSFEEDEKKPSFDNAFGRPKSSGNKGAAVIADSLVPGQTRKSERKEQSLSDFALKMNDINKNRELDIFLIIKNRYHQYYIKGAFSEE